MSFRSAVCPPALLLAAAVLAAAPAQARKAPEFAWGKAGVSYEQYRNDGYLCAQAGLSTNIAHTEPVERLRSATRQLEDADSQFSASASADPMDAGIRHAQEAAAIRAAARPEEQVKAVKGIIFSAAQQCMMKQGYTLIALSEAQRGEIAALKDAQERRLLLHKLASDPAVIEQQRAPLPK